VENALGCSAPLPSSRDHARSACGLSAIYLAMAEVLNETQGRTVLPIGEVRKA